MPIHLRALPFAALLSLAVSFAASAQPTETQTKTIETLEAWGLMGSWSLDCSKPPSSDNGYLGYAVQDGVAVHTRDFGDAQDENEVQTAIVRPDGSIEIVVHFEGFDQTRKYVMVKKDGRVRAWANSLADNSGATIQDGKFTANGEETAWQSQCPMENAPDGAGIASEPGATR